MTIRDLSGKPEAFRKESGKPQRIIIRPKLHEEQPEVLGWRLIRCLNADDRRTASVVADLDDPTSRFGLKTWEDSDEDQRFRF